MSLATHHNAPRELLAELRAAHSASGPSRDQRIADLGLTPMSGGRNNHVYLWDSPEGQVCLKIYKVDDRRRDEREWLSLDLLTTHAVPGIPAPLWWDQDANAPVIAMTRVPGIAITDLLDPTAALPGLAELWRKIHSVPLTDSISTFVRVDHAAHYVERIADIWSKQLAEADPTDLLTADLLSLLDRWWNSGDRELTTRQSPAVFSHGDANLLNWLSDGHQIGCVDWEFAGTSDRDFDAADLIEHISARDISDVVWDALVPHLGVTDPRRLRAAQRTCALRWLAVLWKQRQGRRQEFEAQLQRTQRLFAVAG